MNTPQTSPENTIRVRQPGPVRIVLQYLSFGVSVIFAICILFQVFLAGAGIFVSGTWLGVHSALGWTLALSSFLVLILALLGAPPAAKLISILLVVLVVIQPFLIFIPRKIGLPLLSALHPVNALVIFVVALFIITRTWQAIRETSTKRGSGPARPQTEITQTFKTIRSKKERY